ncbi:hypothetical protein CLL_A3023 [Clostridium botulinum B str. Eklund 17B (NRP)]|uniref:Uncharacterized protein n=1 Tax=Clostridium botulinum (strain Eklund 17B / Type B) TaxID=935198 RepID=B2TPQ2_CLOBB|nr:hypothetical protein CLL_A3023 [Clostridium botulinum B str. Eklund 17B (NRP)]
MVILSVSGIYLAKILDLSMKNLNILITIIKFYIIISIFDLRYILVENL